MPIPTPEKFALVDLVDRFERWDRSLDADAQYVKWSEVESLLTAQAQEIEILKAALSDVFAVNEFAEECQECGVGQSEAWRRAKSLVARKVK